MQLNIQTPKTTKIHQFTGPEKLTGNIVSAKDCQAFFNTLVFFLAAVHKFSLLADNKMIYLEYSRELM